MYNPHITNIGRVRNLKMFGCIPASDMRNSPRIESIEIGLWCIYLRFRGLVDKEE